MHIQAQILQDMYTASRNSTIPIARKKGINAEYKHLNPPSQKSDTGATHAWPWVRVRVLRVKLAELAKKMGDTVSDNLVLIKGEWDMPGIGGVQASKRS